MDLWLGSAHAGRGGGRPCRGPHPWWGADLSLSLTTLPVRVGAGFRLGWAELRAGGLLRPYFARGAAQRSGVIGGGWLAAGAELPALWSVVPIALVGIDLHAQPVAFQLGDQRVLEVERTTAWFALGLAWPARVKG